MGIVYKHINPTIHIIDTFTSRIFKYYLSKICQHQLSNYREKTINMFVIVYRKSKFESNQLIQSLSTIQTVKERFDELNLNYINKSLNNNNELIIDLYKEYINYGQSRELKYKTLFCDYVEEITF